MSVTVVEGAASESAPPVQPAASRAERAAKALEKINGKQPAPAEPAAPTSPELKTEPVTSAAPAAAKPQGEAAELRAAIELERAVRDAQQSRNEAAQYRRELEQARVNEGARQKDWRRALADAGHDVDSVVMDYVGGDGTAAKSEARAQQPASQGDSEIAALRRELADLKNNLAQGAQKYTRDQRLESLRGFARGAGDEFSGLTALEAEDSFLTQLEAIEKQEGRQLGDVELRARMTEFETATRDSVKNQLKRLGGTPWAKAAMRELLEGVVAATTTTTAPPATTPRTDLLNADAAPATRVITPRSLNELKAQAKAKAVAALERRRSGLA